LPAPAPGARTQRDWRSHKSRRRDILQDCDDQARGHLAKDLGAEFASRFSSNVLVFVVNGGGFPSTLGDFTRAVESKATGAGLTVVNTSSVHVSGTQAYRSDLRYQLILSNGRSVALHEEDLFLSHGDGSVQVEVTTEDNPAGTKIIDDLSGSVHRI
jgi:hypothetical protein